MNENIVTLGVDDEPVQRGVAKANEALDSITKRAAAVTKSISDNVESQSRQILTMVDRSRQGIERLVAAAERKAAFAGASNPLSRLNVERDLLLRRVGGDTNAESRIRSAFEQQAGALDQATKIKQAEEAAKLASAANGKLSESFSMAGLAAAAFGAGISALVADATKYSARTETLAVVNERLAITNNLGTAAVEKQVQSVRRLGITQQEARNTINQMIVAQLDVAKASDLARLAQNAAVVAGVSSSDALQTIIAGITEQRVQMLRTVGISVSFEAAFHRAAAAQGRSVEELGALEKKQIAFNEVMSRAPLLTGAYEASLGTASKQLGSLSRYVDEAKDAVGERFLPAMSVLVQAFTSSAIFIKDHASLFANLGGAIITAGAALGTFYTASKVLTSINLAAPALGLAALSPHLAIAAAALTAFGTVLILTKDKLDIQRDSILAHIENLKTQRAQLDHNALSWKEYSHAIEESTTRMINADLALARTEADRLKRGTAQFANSPYGPTVIGVTPAQRFQVGSQSFGLGDYESRFAHRDATFNQKEADREKAEQAALRAAEQARTDRVRIANETLGAQRELERAQRAAVELNARISARPEHGQLTSDDQFVQTLTNLILKVNLDMDEKLREKRYRIDDKTGAVRDMSSDSGFKAVSGIIEQQRALEVKTEMLRALDTQKELDEKYFRDRLDRRVKEEEKVMQVRQRAELQLQDEMEHLQDVRRDRGFDFAQQKLDRQQQLDLSGVGGIQAITINQKIALEDAKLGIEQQYQQRSLELTMRKIHLEETLETAKLQAMANAANIHAGDPRFDAIAPMVTKNFDQVRTAATDSMNDKLLLDQRRVENEKIKLYDDGTRRLFETLKHQADSVVDLLGTRVQDMGQKIKNMLKDAFLNPIKDILSSQISASLTRLLTGRDVSFAGNNSGGRFGGFSAALGALGMGGNVMFGGSPGGLAPAAFATGLPMGGFSIPAMGIPGGMGSFGFPGAPGGTSGFAGPVGIGASGSSAGGGVFNGGGLMGMLGKFGGGGEQAGAALGGMLGLAGGSMLTMAGLRTAGRNPITGGLLSSGGGALLGMQAAGLLGMTGLGGGIFGAGAGLTAAGLMHGGVSGLGMSAAGGAIMGMQLGGPIGALIGGAAGGIAGLVRLFIKGATEKVRQKIQSTYGINVDNKGVLYQIVQIAKQSYGSDYDLAIRSPQIRDMLELYAASTGQKFPLGYAMHPFLLQQQSGSLYQQQQYGNNGSYGYSSSLPYLGGANPTTVITGPPPAQPLTQTITLDGVATTKLLTGQAVNVISTQPKLVSNAVQAAAQTSSNRTGLSMLALEPMTLAR